MLHGSKDPGTSGIAAVTLRQILALVFERVAHADSLPGKKMALIYMSILYIDREMFLCVA